jgi:hypothetical protein
VDSATMNTMTTMPAGIACTAATYVVSNTQQPSAPSIYITTTGTLSSRVAPPGIWNGAAGVVLALLVPLFLLGRGRSLRSQLHLMLLLLVLVGVISLSGCGNGYQGPTVQPTPAGTYFFRVTATSGSTTVTTAPFEVTVLKGY